jgi:hypothetical protein
MAECGLRKTTAPLPAGILGGECIRAADQCACRLVLRPLTPSARDVGWSPSVRDLDRRKTIAHDAVRN